jgi:hypothetical protein
MIQRARRLGLLFESMQPIRIFRQLSRQDLDRHVAIQLLVARAIHLAHAAFANLRADFVTAEFCPGD